MRVVAADASALAAIGPLRCTLWPDSDVAELDDIAGRITASEPDYAVLIAYMRDDVPAGFAELSLRHDYVNGCAHSPVAFVEGIYVAPAHRRQGVARALITAALDWAGQRGAAELASDALLDNAESHAFHAAAGFEETERVVYFRRVVAQGEPRP